MDPLTDVAIPTLTCCAMAVVGLELTARDLARIARRPRKLALATAAQTLLLPLVAFAVIAAADPPIHRTVGLIVIAACPGGAFSNFFTALARSETALSVALTTTCTVVSILTLPLVTAVGFRLFLATAEVVRPPVLIIVGQLGLLLLLPMTAGMALRRWREPLARRIRPPLRLIVLAALVALLVWLLVDRAPDFPAEWLPGAATASLFLVPAMALGEILGRIVGIPEAERLAYVVELGFRNLGVAIVVTVTLLRQSDFLPFATVFFITSVLYALAAVALFRHRSG